MKKVILLLMGLYFTSFTEFAYGLNADFDRPIKELLRHGVLFESSVLRSIISLIIVIGLIYLTAFVYKRLNKFNAKLAGDKNKAQLNKFKIISSQSLGANKNLHVVEINGKYLVLGSTANNITLIKEFDKNKIENREPEFLNGSAQSDCSDLISELMEKYDNGGEDDK